VLPTTAMQILLFECCGDLGDAGRFLVDLAGGLLARAWAVTAVLGEEGRLAEVLRRWKVPVTVISLPRWAYGGPATRWSWSPGVVAAPRLAGALRRVGRPLLYANGAASALLGTVAARLAGVLTGIDRDELCKAIRKMPTENAKAEIAHSIGVKPQFIGRLLTRDGAGDDSWADNVARLLHNRMFRRLLTCFFISNPRI